MLRNCYLRVNSCWAQFPWAVTVLKLLEHQGAPNVREGLRLHKAQDVCVTELSDGRRKVRLPLSSLLCLSSNTSFKQLCSKN